MAAKRLFLAAALTATVLAAPVVEERQNCGGTWWVLTASYTILGLPQLTSHPTAGPNAEALASLGRRAARQGTPV